MKKSLRSFCCLFLLLLLAGCETWQPGGTVYTNEAKGFSITTPASWFFHANFGPNALVASKDGIMIHEITLEIVKLDKPLEKSKRSLKADSTMLDLSEAMADEIRADHDYLGLTLTQQEVVKINGSNAVKIAFEYHLPNDLSIKTLRYAILGNQQLYILSYIAPARHFYDRDVAQFEQSAQSLKVFPIKK